MHRKDGNGVWQDLDNTLELQSMKGSLLYTTVDNRTVFAKSYTPNDEVFTLNENGYSISMTLIDDIASSNTISTGLEISTSVQSAFAEIEAEITNANKRDTSWETIEEASDIDNCSSVTYSNVKSNVDLQYILTGNKIKENIIIKAPSSSYVYVFKIEATGLYAELEKGGDVLLKDLDTGKSKYRIPAPFMYDVNGLISYDVYYELQQVSDYVYELAVVADDTWINDPSREFPVVVDPTLAPELAVWDTYVVSSAPSVNYGTATYLWLASSSNALIYMDLYSIPSDATFVSASLDLHYYFPTNYTSGKVNVNAYTVTEAWDETSVSWSDKPTYSPTPLSTTVINYSSSATSSSPKLAHLDISAAVRAWDQGSPENNGIVLTYASGSSIPIYFKSYESGAYCPKISIVYSHTISGVYALQNAFYSNSYVTLNNMGFYPGLLAYGKYYSSNNNPATTFERSSLFKITPVGSTGRYIIRSMHFNTLGLSGCNGVIASSLIPALDTDVSAEDTFYIEWDGRGFVITPYGTNSAVTLASSSADLTLKSKDTITSTSRWNLKQYTGAIQYGYNLVVSTPELFVGGVCYYNLYTWTTITAPNQPYMTMTSAYSQYATGVWDSSNYKYTLTSVCDGNLQLKVCIIGASTTYKTWYHYQSVKINYLTEGEFSIKNFKTATFAQINGYNESYNYNGAAVTLGDFGNVRYQRWNFIKCSDGYFKIVSSESGLALEVLLTDTDGARIVQDTYTGSSTQEWWAEIAGTNSVIIRPKSAYNSENDWCLTVDDDSEYLCQRPYTTAEHNRNSWVLHGCYDTTMYAVTATDTEGRVHQHSSGLLTLQALMMEDAFLYSNLHSGEFTPTNFREELKNANMVVTRSHGVPVQNQFTGDILTTGLLLNDTTVQSEMAILFGHEYNGMTSSSVAIRSDDDYSNLKIVLFIACFTAAGENNLTKQIVENGAEAAVGFTCSIYCNAANNWMYALYSYLMDGYALESAVSYANGDVSNFIADEETDIEDAVRIYGNGDVTIYD